MRKTASFLFRVVIKLVFIALLLRGVFSMVWGRQALSAILPLFELFFGAIGACLLSMLARRHLPFQPPSLALFAGEIAAVAVGFALGRFLSGIVLELLFGLGMIAGALGLIALLVLSLFASAIAADNLAQTIRSMGTHEREILARDLRGGHSLGDVGEMGTRRQIRRALDEENRHHR